jgi:hypothetical protein
VGIGGNALSKSGQFFAKLGICLGATRDG